jgi:PAS domain S-box-containing protein
LASVTSKAAIGGDRPVWRVSIRIRFVAVTALVAFCAAAAVAISDFAQIRALTLQSESQRLRNEAELVAAHIRTPYDIMRNDVLTLSKTPPISGIARSLAHRGYDPDDGSTLLHWRKRLETIFVSILSNAPAYVRIRYIGVADGGRELARVDRVDGSIRVVPPGEYEQKGGEPYFDIGIGTPRGEVRLSAVTLDRDNGTIDSGMPVLHAMTPVYGPDGVLFGLVVIAAKYDALLDGVLRSINPVGDLFLLDEAGNYIVKPRRRPFGELQLAELRHDEVSNPAIAAISALRPGERLTRFDDRGKPAVAAAAQVDLRDLRRGHEIQVGLAVSEDRFLSPAREALHSAVLAGAPIVLVATLVAFLFANLLSKPLKLLAEEIRSTVADVPDNVALARRSDEIGDVYRAFEDLSRELDSARAAERAVYERMHTLRYKAMDALIAIDERGTIVEFNESAQKMFGYGAEEAIGRNVSMLMPSPHREAHDGYIGHYLRTGEERIIGGIRNVEAIRRNGELFPVELRVSEVEVDGKRFFNGTVRDVAERVALERRVAAQMRELKRSNRDLDEFAYIASHDLKEPLRGISNHARFLEEDYGDVVGDDGKKRIARLQELCVKASNLITDLLLWSRLGRDEQSRDRIDPNAVVREFRETHAEMLAERNAEVVVETRLPPIFGDRTRIASLFQNLIVNGIKYNDSAAKTIRIGYRPDAPSPLGAPIAAFYVADNGIGIAEEHRDIVFQIFKRLNSEKAYGSGTGAGLSFAQKIVERHGGRIWIDSTPGEGSTFYFTLSEAADEFP